MSDTSQSSKMREEFEAWQNWPTSPITRTTLLNAFEAGWLARGKQGGWISVEERLPHPSSAVLFFTKDGCWESGYFWADEDEPVRWECERTAPQDERIDFFEGQVTHWMIPDPPLPAAPTETGRGYGKPAITTISCATAMTSSNGWSSNFSISPSMSVYRFQNW